VELTFFFYYAVGTALLVYEVTRVSRKWLIERSSIPWNQVSAWIDALYKSVSEHPPDIIVGLGRGGAVVAGFISAKFRDDPHHRTRLIPIANVDRIYLRSRTVIVGLHGLDTFGKKVLLLNADSYTGDTLNVASKLLSYSHSEAQLQTGSLVILNDIPETLRPKHVGSVRPLKDKDRVLPWGRRPHPRNEIDHLPEPRIMVVLNGLVATGKTSVANALLKELGYIPIYSDWYWFTRGLQDRSENMEANVRHYKHMFSLAVSAAASGKGVVLDTTSSRKEIRDYMRENARRFGIRVVFIQCRCTKESSISRIRLRKHIGPYDFGTEFEYDRIERMYQKIDAPEHRDCNFIDLDTDSLSFEDVHVLGGDDQDGVEEEIKKITQAIDRHYLAQIRDEQSSSAANH